MSINFDIAEPVNRILSWLEHVVPVMQRRRQRAALLKVFEKSKNDWLTRGLLTRELGLNDREEMNLDATAKLLATLPTPGPARPDRSPKNRNTPRAQQLWGLTERVGQ
jgi:hypothetical protein